MAGGAGVSNLMPDSAPVIARDAQPFKVSHARCAGLSVGTVGLRPALPLAQDRPDAGRGGPPPLATLPDDGPCLDGSHPRPRFCGDSVMQSRRILPTQQFRPFSNRPKRTEQRQRWRTIQAFSACRGEQPRIGRRNQLCEAQPPIGKATFLPPTDPSTMPAYQTAERLPQLCSTPIINGPQQTLLFELSLGLSAWKTYGAQRWALRCSPSSGNLHPTEGYLLCPALPGLCGGVYHHLSRDHALEHRAAVDEPRWTEAFSDSGVLLGVSSVHWREAWKYGMRGWRYCQQDCGHVIAALTRSEGSRLAEPVSLHRRWRSGRSTPFCIPAV
jgi:hypothetical protein